ncbi:MAG TPA: ABC transporter permease [Solirubrobacteraceae bacterium]|nr:ABC transporter permease [Solirubrobacteraceae bacterium]
MSEEQFGALPREGAVETGGSIVEVLVHGTDVPPALGAPAGGSMARRRVAMLLENKMTVAGLVVIVGLILFSFVGPLIYHTNQTGSFLLRENLPPSGRFPLGTDPEGRDELGRLMLGGQSSLEVGFGVAVVATLFGMMWGAIAGFTGGILDSLMMRIVDALLAIPLLFFIVLLASIIRPNLVLIFLVIAAGSWMEMARLVRGEVLALRERDYVAASRVFGARSHRIILRHLIPNVMGVVVVAGTFIVADSILAFAALAFLGLGVPPPATSWGDLLTIGVDNVFNGFWWQLWPAAVALVLVEIAVNIVGDGVRDVVEQRLIRR